MKHLFLVFAILVIASSVNAKTTTSRALIQTKAFTSLKKQASSNFPILIYGRAYIKGNSVTCMGGRKLCAVIPQLETETEDPSAIIIYDEDGNEIGVYQFSQITINETEAGTEINWIP